MYVLIREFCDGTVFINATACRDILAGMPVSILHVTFIGFFGGECREERWVGDMPMDTLLISCFII